MELSNELRKLANLEKSKVLQKFFKTGKGEYAEGDVFLGLTVPKSRKIAKKYSNIIFQDVESLLSSKIHEERLIALLILVERFNKSPNKKEIFDFYLNNTKYINNWDLVDLTADKIVGNFLFNFSKDYPVYKILLTNLAKSSNLWERRIAIISTFHFIKNNQFNDTLKIAEILLNDKHDLIHKAIGWMLREIGKRSEETEEQFLKKHYKSMPRTMLRYAIERFTQKKREAYLKGEI